MNQVLGCKRIHRYSTTYFMDTPSTAIYHDFKILKFIQRQKRKNIAALFWFKDGPECAFLMFYIQQANH